MTMPLTISNVPPEHPALDYAFLRQEGIRYLEKLSGHLWTDYNAHDPGITILEQLCYAITDLAHRVNYDLPDLLAREGEDTFAGLFSPAAVLSCNPVTQKDLRKLVIDVAGVKNAWIETDAVQEQALLYYPGDDALSLVDDGSITAEPVQLRGLYRVLVELADHVYLDGEPGEETRILQAVKQRLHAHRGLCEDFTSVMQLQPELIQVQARIEIDAVDDVEGLLVDIYQRLANHISPPVPVYRLQERLAAGKRIDEIFEGPLLQHGFIDDDELAQAQRRTILRTSDFIREIMDVPGVRAVRSIGLSKGLKHENWSLPLEAGKAPKLNINASHITLERNQLPTRIDQSQVAERYNARLRRQSLAYELATQNNDLPLPTGRDRHVEQYQSIQSQFPATYGIGELGLAASATPQRRAQAKQLQAYLMFFDQILANYFTQLAHTRDLFSLDTPEKHTYFAQVLDDPALGLDALNQHSGAALAERLQAIVENPQGATGLDLPETDRRNRFLNHLLARFSEEFTDYSLILYGATRGMADELAEEKRQFLQDYPRVSRERGTAFNYLQPFDANNRAGLELRLRRKLNLREPQERFYLIEHILLRPMAGDATQIVPYLANPRSKDPFSLQLSIVFPENAGRFRDENFRIFVERTIREETPAHIIAGIHWFDTRTVSAISRAYLTWVEKRREYWQQALGVSS